MNDHGEAQNHLRSIYKNGEADPRWRHYPHLAFAPTRVNAGISTRLDGTARPYNSMTGVCSSRCSSCLVRKIGHFQARISLVIRPHTASY